TTRVSGPMSAATSSRVPTALMTEPVTASASTWGLRPEAGRDARNHGLQHGPSGRPQFRDAKVCRPRDRAPGFLRNRHRIR
ncbi:hypothetical protein, partial [Streptomyces mirabilis]|uniref:hypothetical protein n=1 Tax=Streptomyces mirabilis TaxID=68239 RepID=UPI0036B8A333